jgi:hypothetical protein
MQYIRQSIYSGIEYISVADETLPDIGLRFDIPL